MSRGSPPRRYALDASPLLGRRTGIGRYVEELVDHFVPLLCEDERLTLFAGTFRQNPLFGISHEPLTRRARADRRVRVRRSWLPFSVLRTGWNLLDWPGVDRLAGRPHVFHGTNYRLPPPGRAAGIATFHDMAVLRYPDTVPPAFRQWFRTTVDAAARRASWIVADSDASLRDTLELTDADPERITSIPLAVSEAYLVPGDRDQDRRHIAERYGITQPYVLYVGTTHPRKNLPRLLDAFAKARAAVDLPHRLVLVGDKGFGSGDVQTRVARLGLADTVSLPGYVPEDDLPRFYRAADLFAFPSLYEGFGFPVLEAMATGCPVVTSSVSSLPEVAGDAALMVDPLDVDGIAERIEQVLTRPELAAELRELGREQAARFSWQRTAEAHVALYRRLAEESEA